MKFSEKLQTLRKENKMSQEQLADLMDVSRQAVSKWESGTAYPEMDKLLTLCKIFNCSLDDLTNDEVTEINVAKDSKIKINTIIDSFFNIIKKIYYRIINMSATEIIKMIIESLIIIFILYLCTLPFEYFIYEITSNIEYNSYIYHIGRVLANIMKFIVVSIYIIIFCYIFKIRYLDDYDYSQVQPIPNNKNDKENEEPKEEKSELKVIYKSKYSIIDLIASILLYFVKFISICIAFPIIIVIFCLCTLLAISIIGIINKIISIGLIISIISSIILSISIFELLINFIFSNKVNLKRIFITFITSICTLGVGVGIACYEITKYNFINEVPAELNNIDTQVEEIKYEDKLTLWNNTYYDQKITYTVDNNMGNNIKITFEKYKDIEINIDQQGNHLYFYPEPKLNSKDCFKIIIKNVKDKEIYNYEKIYRYNINVTTSEDIIKKLKENRQAEIERQYDKEIEYYEASIRQLENENEELREQMDELEYKNTEYEAKISEYEEKIKNLRESISE